MEMDDDELRVREIEAIFLDRGFLRLHFDRDDEGFGCLAFGPVSEPSSRAGDVEIIGVGRTRREAAEDALRQLTE